MGTQSQPSSALDMVRRFKAQEAQLARATQQTFRELFEADFFRALEYHHIGRPSAINSLPARPAFYVILSNWDVPDNACTLRSHGLRAIYRGHAHNLRERVESHLANASYVSGKKQRDQPFWTRCLKISDEPGKGGIDIDIEPYSKATWATMHLVLPDSTRFMREQAEWAFEQVFGKPAASRDKGRSATTSDSLECAFCSSGTVRVARESSL